MFKNQAKTDHTAAAPIRIGDDVQPDTGNLVAGVGNPAQGDNTAPAKFMPTFGEVAGMIDKDTAAAIGQQAAGSRMAAASANPTSIIDLPDDVKKNIVGYEDMELDEMLLRIINAFTAAIAVDRIIMLLYTEYKKTMSRTKVLARLRYLEKAGSVKKVEGVRSHYTRA